MTEKIREILDVVTARVFAHRPADKARWAKATKAREPEDKQDDSHSSI